MTTTLRKHGRTAWASARWIFCEADVEPTEAWAALILTGWAASQTFAATGGHGSVMMVYLTHLFPAPMWYAPAAFFAVLHDVGLALRSKQCRAAALLFECALWPALSYAQFAARNMPTGTVYSAVFFFMSLWAFYRLVTRWRLPARWV